MPGPPPKPEHLRRRRNASTQVTQLPAEGRQGSSPAWPLGRPTKAEEAVWAQLWHTPQAAAWERLGWFRTVARYCRFLVQSERKDATARSEEHTSELQSLMRISYAVFCL